MNAPDDAKIRRKKKYNRIADVIFLVQFLVMTVFSGYSFIMVGTDCMLTVIGAIWLFLLILSIIKGRKRFLLLGIIVNLFCLVVYLFLLSFPSSFGSAKQWRYDHQRRYVEIIQNIQSECFPDKIPEYTSDYYIEYIPGMWQGTGHFRVHFKTSAKQLEQYEKEYSAQAIYTIPLTDFNRGITAVKEISPKAAVSHGDDKSLMVAYDQDYWAGHEKDATVYVVSAVHNWNHPHSGAVIINKTDKMVEFTHLG
ncbi:MAG: hypothetical protein K6G33_04030 [Ruminococcus sp.]|nr:hypothetical protein [Ruminococcus sp.]